MSFFVAARVSEASGGGQRRVHDDWFLSIEEANAYRLVQPDADALAVAVAHDRYPMRDLTRAELETGEVDPAVDEARGLTETIARIYRDART